MKAEILVIISVLGLLPLIVWGQSNTTRTTLRIAVPIREFSNFVTVGRDPTTGENSYGGFAIEVFKAAIGTLPTPVLYEFVAFDKPDGTMNGTFDDMLQAVSSKDYDGAVGDISILFHRLEYVDFTMPYMESSITMLVPIKPQPTTTKASGLSLIPVTEAIVIITFVISIIVVVIYIVVTACAIRKESEAVKLRTREEAKFVSAVHIILLFPSLFVIFTVLLASYIVSEASSLDSQGRSGSIKNLTQLIRMGSNVGYREGSFVYNLLVIKGLDKSKLVSLKTEEEMVDMLSKGTSKGGVDAIVANAPHLKFLQSKHCDAFTTVPTTNLHATGFGFAFGKGSETVDDVSRGILKIVDNGQMGKIQDRTIGSLDVCQDDSLSFDDASLHLPHSPTWMVVLGAVSVGFSLFCTLYICWFDYHWYTVNNKVIRKNQREEENRKKQREEENRKNQREEENRKNEREEENRVNGNAGGNDNVNVDHES